VSTYDVVHPTPSRARAAVLTGISAFWFDRLADVVPEPRASLHRRRARPPCAGARVAVRRLEMLPVECVVRGYITGSGWKDYRRSGASRGTRCPPGLRESERLPEPLFTPSTKATRATTRRSTSRAPWRRSATAGLAERVRDVSLELVRARAEHAPARGVILADTKFEFGLDAGGTLVLGDEALTPDSSRYWPAEGYAPGGGQPSFDKQFVRDWAAGSGWDKTEPAPALPDDVVAGTVERYEQAYARITGEPLSAWLERTGAAR
jgi:phosphoribosylaminoimidazole-succinocarboxamide synthase